MNDNRNSVIKVGLVDDHVILMRPFFDALNKLRGIKAIFLVHSGEDLFQLLSAATELPDIILMDIEMPGMTGIEATKKLYSLFASIKVIALTGRSNPHSIVQMKEAGACAYLRKDVGLNILEEAIRSVYIYGEYYGDLSHQQANNIDNEIIAEATMVFSEREVDLLHYMSLGYSYDRMAEAMSLSKSGMDKYRQSLCEKLHTQKQAVMVIKALQMGLLPRNKS